MTASLFGVEGQGCNGMRNSRFIRNVCFGFMVGMAGNTICFLNYLLSQLQTQTISNGRKPQAMHLPMFLNNKM